MVRFRTEKIVLSSRNIAPRTAAGSHSRTAGSPVLPAAARILAALLLFSLPLAAGAQQTGGRAGTASPPAPQATEASEDAGSTVRRLCILVGANDGGEGREILRYAVSDAKNLRRVLTTMGGVDEEDCLLQVDPSRARLLDGLDRIAEMARRASEKSRRVEVIFYYSGHSDTEGLLLGGEKLQYRRLRDSFNDIRADVRIGILDSCFSGEFTRLKGGTRQAPFMTDTAYDMQGYAFLSSSSSDEASQESDRLRSSFFTHYLVAGLRGAADQNNDRRVTLNELYQFAYNETLSRTETTFAGPQHPNYSIKMSGTGDVVITYMHSGSSLLRLSETLSGVISIRDSRGRLVTELGKEPGRTTTLALEPDSYTLLYHADGALRQAEVDISDGGQRSIGPDAFSVVAYEYTRLRGDRASGNGTAAAAAAGTPHTGSGGTSGSADSYREEQFSFSTFPVRHERDKVRHRTSLSLFGSRITALDGMSVGLGVGIVEEDARWLMANALANYAGGETEGFQLTFLLNYMRDDSSYVQISSGANYVGGDFTGLQGAALANVTTGSVQGFQSSGLFNYVSGSLGGVQSSMVNLSSKINGIQTGMFNWAGTVNGIQIGMVNIAGQMNGLPLGLINVSRNGGIELQTWMGGQSDLNTGLLFRSGPIYTRFSAGTNGGLGIGSSSAWSSYGLSLGTRVHIGRFYFDIDAGVITLDKGSAGVNIRPDDEEPKDRISPQGRVALGYELLPGIALFTGLGTAVPIDHTEPESSGPARPLFLFGSSLRLF